MARFFRAWDLPTIVLLGTALLAAGFAWLTPDHYQPWLTYHSELAMALAGVCFGGWAIWRGRSFLNELPAVAAVGFFAAAVPIAQLALGVISFRGDAWLASMYLAGFALMAWLGHACASQFGALRSLKPLHAIILAGALASMWLALYQWLGFRYLGMLAINLAPGMRPYANLIQPNQLATLLVLGVLAVAFLFEDHTVGGPTALVAVTFLIFGVAMTQSRAGLLEVAVIAVILLIRRSAALTGRIGVRSIVIVACPALVMPVLWEALRGQSAVAPMRDAAQMASAGTRPIHWASMADAALRKPWLGYGWNQVSEAQYDVALDHAFSHETISHSHNLALDLLVENGIPLGIVFIAALSAWFILAIRRVRSPTTLLSLCSVIAVFVHALLEFPLHYTYFLLPVGVLMGAVSSQFSTGFVIRVPNWLAPTIWALLTSSTVLGSVEYFQIESEVQDMRFSAARIGSPKPIKPLHSHIFTQMDRYWNFSYSVGRRDLTADDLEDMRKTMLRFSSKENMLRYARSLALSGQASKVPDVLRRVCPINSEAGCNDAHRIWESLGKTFPEVAAISWPTP